ncbi:MAG TPA: TonB family protein [Bacteroidota bacterium]|nr:TonB family protein [Bacteroidota bacterium]
METPAHDIPIEEKLREVYDKTDSREYAEALDSLEATRLTDPGNIYISALKRQLESLLSLSQADELSEDKRRELMDPMQGIIECAVRDNHRQHTGAPAAHAAGPAPESPAAESGDAQKELEALKLLYFQRASKFVMKGEYEQALAEVRRVFVVDPQNTIAREYASRVEQLIQHARRLAADPETPSPAPAAPAIPAAEPETPRATRERPTAWDDAFVAPRQSTSLPEHRPAPSSSRQTMAYGDRLAVSLAASHGEEEEHAPRRKSKVFLLLAVVILTPLLAGVGIAVFSGKSGGSGATAQFPVQTVSATTNAAATIGAAQAAPPPAKSVEEHAAPAPAKQTASAAENVKSVHAAPAEESAAHTDHAQEPPPKPAVTAPQKPVLLASAAPSSAPPVPAPSTAAPQPATQQAPPPAFVAVEKEPQIVRLEKPEFPSFVWKMGGEGQVVIRVLIDANGKPLDSQILKSTNPVFERPVIDAVMKSQFNPAQMGQGPVAAWLTIPFHLRQPK